MFKELILPLFAMAIVSSMLLPLPPAALDFLLVGNLLLALVLFFSALYVNEPLKFSALPTILLLATLYRLALNVSTTRLILMGGQGSDLIQAFGGMVTQGNLVVGAVVFLVITLVQYIVIAKGSERVAEVSARFTLDALPGRQMSIDADVRAGLIDFSEARTKREELQIESRFYGALDGAMKFIKGDAIAGFLITGINVIGGLAIGIGIQQLDPTTALSRYTLLTVGDGLLSQIPAFLNSLAAGVVVTRVHGTGASSLARDILMQLGQSHQARRFVGVAALSFACVPGVPTLPLFLLGGVLLVLPRQRPEQDAGQSGGSRDRSFMPSAVPLFEINLPESTMEALTPGLMALSFDFQKRTHERTGLFLAPLQFRRAENSQEVSIFFRGVATRVVQIENPDSLLENLSSELDQVVKDLCTETVDDLLTRRMLDATEEYAPELVASIVPDIASVTQISEVTRDLVREGIPVRNFDLILQAVAEYGSRVAGQRELLQHVRIGLGRVISSAVTGAEEEIRAYLLDPTIDAKFVEAESGERILDPKLVERIAEEAATITGAGEVLVTSRRARRLVKECLEAREVEVSVICLEEVAPGFDLQMAGTIGDSFELASDLYPGAIEAEI